MRRISANIILVLLFAVSGMSICLPLLAGIYFNAGEALEAKYSWRMADERFDLAVRLDPLNAGHYEAIGRSYVERAAVLKNRASLLLRAESEYKKSHALNPYNVRCLMELAAVEEELFLADTSEYSDRLGCSVGHFEEAFEKDPHHYIFNYDIGRNFLRIWDYLSEEERQFALKRFKRYLELAPWYEWRVYPKIWDKVKDFGVLLEITPKNLRAYEHLYSSIWGNSCRGKSKYCCK